MIVEQRDYHVFTGKLPELVRLYDNTNLWVSAFANTALRAITNGPPGHFAIIETYKGTPP